MAENGGSAPLGMEIEDGRRPQSAGLAKFRKIVLVAVLCCGILLAFERFKHHPGYLSLVCMHHTAQNGCKCEALVNNRTGNQSVPASNVAKYCGVQLRSVLDEIGHTSDSTWDAMVISSAELATATHMILSRPTSKAAEEGFLQALDLLTEVLLDITKLPTLPERLGWQNPDNLFQSLGEYQVMLVDTDHNDLDDRPAIILLAFLFAGANAKRKQHNSSAAFTLYLDTRNWERSNGLVLWRTARLAARLNIILKQSGLLIELIVSDPNDAISRISKELGVSADPAELEKKQVGAGVLLSPGTARTSLKSVLPEQSIAGLWLLSGISSRQVMDFNICRARGIRFRVYEQAVPAWQSIEVGSNVVQPAWKFPPNGANSEFGFGAEPSNIRSSEASYAETLRTYLQFQSSVGATDLKESGSYKCAALARQAGTVPAPPGKPMLNVSARPMRIIPGSTYVVQYAIDAEQTRKTFSRLLQAAATHYRDTLHAELCVGPDDLDEHHAGFVKKYGTNMPDPITVAMLTRPDFKGDEVMRRMALVKLELEKAIWRRGHEFTTICTW